MDVRQSPPVSRRIASPRGLHLDRRRVGILAAILLALQVAGLLFVVAGTHGWIVRLSRPTTTDFVSFYAAGSLAAAGKPALAYNRAAHLAAEEKVAGDGIGYQFFNYPPVYLMPFALLARLPYLVSFGLFEAATLAFYLLVGLRILGERGGAALLALLAVPVVFWTIGLGQNGFLTAALFGAATLSIDRRPALSGLLFGLTCYKPQFGLLVPLALAAGGYWRAIVTASATVAALVLLSAAVFGAATWGAFFNAIGAAPATYGSGRILFAGMANPFGGARLLGADAPLAYAVQAVLAAIAAIVVAVVWRRHLSLPIRAAVLCAATLMAAPIALLYDLLVGVVAAAWLMRDRRAPAAAPWEGWVLAVLCLAAIGGPRTGEIWRVPLYPLIALAIFTLAAARAWRERVLRTAPQAFTQS